MDFDVTDGTSSSLVLTSFPRTDNARIRAYAMADNILEISYNNCSYSVCRLKIARKD